MSCKNKRVSHKADCVKCSPSVGDVVRWGIIPCRVVGLCGCMVYLVALSLHGIPYGEVLTTTVDEVFSYCVGSLVSFRLNGDLVSGVVKSYDVYGQPDAMLDG